MRILLFILSLRETNLFILAFAFFTRVYNLSFPDNFYFDEVYNAFTTLEFVKGNIAAYEWFHTSPVEGTAYGWTHPPLAKLISGLGVLVFGENSFGWRLGSALVGTGIVFLVYLVFAALFPTKKRWALLAAFFASLDGLLLVHSRINMNDIFAVFFILLAFWIFAKYRLAVARKKQKWVVRLGFALGLLLATKWTGFYAIALFGVWVGFDYIRKIESWPRLFASFVLIPSSLYLVSYSQYFLLGGAWDNFIELQKQMWWYNTNLEATHIYQSSWWTWPINLRPIWYFVEEGGDKVAKIYALGNPVLWWFGAPAILYTFYKAVTSRNWRLWLIIAGFAAFWLPWARAPRVMFIYHYLPSVPFLCLSLAYSLSRISVRYRYLVSLIFCLLAVLAFIFFYPHWTGIFVPQWWDELYYWIPSWR